MYLLSRVCSRPAREQDPEGGQRHSWDELVHGYKGKNISTFFKMGGLGKLVEQDGYETWLCFKDHFCAVEPTNPWFCFVYHETNQVFTPWGENNQLKLVPVPEEEKLCTCGKGSTGPNGGTCTACEAGKYKDAPGASACTACPANSTSPAGLCGAKAAPLRVSTDTSSDLCACSG